jgi:predicted nuclease of restriction endonuclease-like RecB superfamily
MLRGEHVMARLSRGKLIPHRLSPNDGRALRAVGELCDLYAAHRGRPRATLERTLTAKEEELGPQLDARRGFRIVRALCKLLEEHAEWEAPTAADPYSVRTRVFELASSLPEPPATTSDLLGTPTRDEVLAQVSREMSLEEPVAAMYADRRGAQLLGPFEKPTPEELIARYNVAQVQGVLYAAKDMTVDLGVGADARLVFRYVKLFGLIYAVEPLTEDAYRLRLDGPLSLFGGTRRYGLRLAKFLPALLLTAPWSLHASVEWKGRDASLELDSASSNLTGHYVRPENGEDDDLVEAFRRAWERAKSTESWRLLPGPGVIPLPGQKTALVPDFTIEDLSGEKVHLEILGFWSERRLIERVALLRAAASRGHRVLVAASERLGASPEALSEASKSGVIPFKGRLEVSAVLDALKSGAAEDPAVEDPAAGPHR